MKARGQGLLALALGAVMVAAGVGFARLGPKAPSAAPSGEAPSGAWYCPHGGWKGWREGTIYLANPGTADVQARLTSLSSGGARPPITVTVPAGGDVAQTVPVTDRSSSTFVESFGGWVAAGWLTRGGGGEFGAGAEPCAPAASQTWYAADNTTEQGQDAYLVVMNPFAAAATFDVVLYTGDRAPIRNSAWTGLTLPPRHSVALHLNTKIPGEAAVTAAVIASAGRVAAASVGINASGGVRSTLAWPGTASQAVLPVAAGTDQSQLLVTVPGGAGVGLAGTQLSGRPTAPVGGLVNASQDPATAHVYPITTSGPSAVELTAHGGAQIVGALRATGQGHDDASTGGATAPAISWVVTPTVAGQPGRPGVVLVNPGSEAAAVTLHLLAPAGGAPAADISVQVPAEAAVGVPRAFLDSAPTGCVLATSDGLPIVAMGASTSLGQRGIVDYALAMGIPVPSLLP